MNHRLNFLQALRKIRTNSHMSFQVESSSESRLCGISIAMFHILI
jgi:hypothetical protein